MRNLRIVATTLAVSLCLASVAHAQAPAAPKPAPWQPKPAAPPAPAEPPAPEPPPEPPPPPEPDQSALGAPGESCRARADCRTGLACVSNVCRDEREGTTCGSTAECGGNLRCVNNTCVSNLSVDKNKSGGGGNDGPSAIDEWMAFELGGTHAFVGMSWVGGPTLFVGPGDSEALGAFSYALRGGVMIDRLELALELSPMTHLPSTAYLDPTFQFTGLVGYHIPITDRISWPIKGGIGMVAANLPGERVWFQARADLIGISVLAGHFLIDFHLPSFRFTTDFQDIHTLGWYPGVTASYVF